MPLLVNIGTLEDQPERLAGELSVRELDFGFEDEVVRFSGPLHYELLVQKLQDSILLTGRLELPVTCECIRCLEAFPFTIQLIDWTCHVPLEGEERATVIRDSVDLTPYLREDMILALPTHPVCREDCQGLTKDRGQTIHMAGTGTSGNPSSPWDELNNLKLKS